MGTVRIVERRKNALIIISFFFRLEVLKSNKSSGLDQIINEYIKNSPDNVIRLIVKLFNLVLETGVVPSEWGEGFINPLFFSIG